MPNNTTEINIAIATNPTLEQTNSKAILITNATPDQIIRLYTVICDWVGKENLR